MPPIQCITDLAKYEKDNTIPDLYRTEFNILKEKYPDHTYIYTDGSKCGNSVAYALVTPFFTSCKRISDGCSIFTAEAMAVLRSLQYINKSQINKFIICSDSLSLIQSIDMQCVKNPLTVSSLSL